VKNKKENYEENINIEEEQSYENDRVVEITEQLLRMTADFDNYKRRERENLKRHITDAKVEVIEKILPLADTLNKGVAMIVDERAKAGLEMVYKQFILHLEALGVQVINALGEEFNPNFHNAVLDEAVKDESKIGTVLEVFTTGYMMGDKVLRYADVKIGK